MLFEVVAASLLIASTPFLAFFFLTPMRISKKEVSWMVREGTRYASSQSCPGFGFVFFFFFLQTPIC
jgi:hypothetical protein